MINIQFEVFLRFFEGGEFQISLLGLGRLELLPAPTSTLVRGHDARTHRGGSIDVVIRVSRWMH